MGKVFVTSDTHFHHRNIIKYCNRPFGSVMDMDLHMVKAWNSIVKKEDKVFHLGDFGFGNKIAISRLVKNLNGNIHLIKGNHDRHSTSFYMDCGFKSVYDYPILYNGFFILSHEPQFIPCDIVKNIHGHIHNNHVLERIVDGKNLYYNVSMEVVNYVPVEFDKIIEYYDMGED